MIAVSVSSHNKRYPWKCMSQGECHPGTRDMPLRSENYIRLQEKFQIKDERAGEGGVELFIKGHYENILFLLFLRGWMYLSSQLSSPFTPAEISLFLSRRASQHCTLPPTGLEKSIIRQPSGDGEVRDWNR